MASEERMAWMTQKRISFPELSSFRVERVFSLVWFIFDNLTQNHTMLQEGKFSVLKIPWSHPELVTREHAGTWGHMQRLFSRATSFLNWAKSFSIAVTFSAKEVVVVAEQCFTGNYFI